MPFDFTTGWNVLSNEQDCFEPILPPRPQDDVLPVLPTPTPSEQPPHQHVASAADGPLTNEIKAELIQIFFDRIHPTIPILCQSRTLDWIGDDGPMNEYRRCLRNAIFTCATAVSGRFDGIGDELYAKTRSAAEKLDLEGGDWPACRIEHAQSWIFLTLFEFAKTNYRRGWLSAGRVFRLVQYGRFFETDKPRPSGSPAQGEEAVLTEEKRRVFWAAYCLDHLIAASEGTCVTLGEGMIYTRLPSDDADFANASTTKVASFLPEALLSIDTTPTSPFNECIILITLCGKIISQEHIFPTGTVYNAKQVDMVSQYDWAESMVARRIENLRARHAGVHLATDPLIIFAYMIAQSAALYSWQSAPKLTGDDRNPALTWRAQDKGMIAAQETARLAGELSRLGLFKAHLLTPLAIYLVASRLKKYLLPREGATSQAAESVESSLRACVEALRRLQSVNNLASHYLQKLE